MQDYDFNNIPEQKNNKREKIDFDAIFFKPALGSNKIRIVSMAGKKSKKCWTTYYNSKKEVSVRCPETGNPLQIDGRTIANSFILKVIDRKTQTIKLYEFGSQIKNQIAILAKNLKNDPATANDSLTQYDLNIERGPEGQNPLYMVSRLEKNKMQTNKEKLEHENDAELIAADNLVIEEYIKPWSVKRINEQILGIGEDGKPLVLGANQKSSQNQNPQESDTSFNFGENVEKSKNTEKIAVGASASKNSNGIDASDSDFLETL